MPKTLSNGINLYSKFEFEQLKEAAIIASFVLESLLNNANPGVSTFQLEKLAEQLIKDKGASPAFRGYENYPYCTCLSVNEQIVHGTPSNRILQAGDVISIDVGVIYKGFYSDNARTTIVDWDGKITNDWLMLGLARKALEHATLTALPGHTVGDIGYTIQKFVTSLHKKKNEPLFKVFKDFQGHGIGINLHESPNILNMGFKGHGLTLLPGMSICIEPVVLYREAQVVMELNQEYNINLFTTDNKSSSAHYENHIYISDSGPITLTDLYGY